MSARLPSRDIESVTIGAGKFLLGAQGEAWLYLGAAVVGAIIIWRDVFSRAGVNNAGDKKSAPVNNES